MTFNGLEKCTDCGKLALSSEVVTIPASEYERLIRSEAESKERRSISGYRAVSRSGIGLQPELADFILEKFETMTVGKVHAACVARFGDAAPSRSSIFRFVDKMKSTARR